MGEKKFNHNIKSIIVTARKNIKIDYKKKKTNLTIVIIFPKRILTIETLIAAHVYQNPLYLISKIKII